MEGCLREKVPACVAHLLQQFGRALSHSALATRNETCRVCNAPSRCPRGRSSPAGQGQKAHAEQVHNLMKQSVRFVACENTMREKSIKKEDLFPDVVTAPAGAVGQPGNTMLH